MSDNNYPFKGLDCNAHPLKEDQPSDVAACQLRRVNQNGRHGYGYKRRLWEGESVFYTGRERAHE